MKKNLGLAILSVVIALICLLLYGIVKKDQQKKEIESQISNLPKFEFFDIKSGLGFSNQDLIVNTPVYFIYFNTECEHCKNEIAEFEHNIDQFNKAQLVFISFEEPEILNSFFNTSLLYYRDNIFILSDKQLEFEKIFGDSPFPTIIIYNKQNALVKIHKGEANIKALLKLLDS